MERWRLRHWPAGYARSLPTGAVMSGRWLVADRVHGGEFAPAEIHHALIEAAPPRDPPAHRRRIDLHQKLSAAATDDGRPLSSGCQAA